ncbi:MAG: hypothetical protein Q9218_000782 [Villophora microphyllina]
MLLGHPDFNFLPDKEAQVAQSGNCIHEYDGDSSMFDDVSDDDVVVGFDDEASLDGAWYLGISKHTQIIHRLINVLPASTEMLTLDMVADRNIMQQMLRRLPQRKAERLPRLREITYQCEERCTLGVEKACESVGVEVKQILKYGGFKNHRRDSLDSDDFWLDYDDQWGWWTGHYYNDYDEDHYHHYYSPWPEVSEEEHLIRLAEDDDRSPGIVPNVVYDDIAYFEWLVSLAPAR